MDYILVYEKENPKPQWIYIPSNNEGCFIDGDAERYYNLLIENPLNINRNFHDIETYTRYAESINGYPMNSLYYENQSDLPYEFW